MTYASVIHALADPTRRTVFETVARTPGPVSAIARALPVSRPAVSQHLKVLSDAGLVSATAEGTRRVYSVRQDGLIALRAYLDQFWDAVMTGFADDIRSLKEAGHD